MREKILNYFKNNSDQKLNISKIMKQLKITDKNMVVEFFAQLKALEEDNKIICLEKDEYLYLDPKKYNKGYISINKKEFGFIKTIDGNEEFYVPRNNLGKAISGDLILFKVIKEKEEEKNRVAQVIKVLQRESNSIIGTVKKNRYGNKYLQVTSTKLQNFNADILNPNKANFRDVVKASIVDINYLDHNMVVRIEEKIGSSFDLDIDILKIIYEHSIPTEFSKEVLKEANAIPQFINLDKIDKRRVNLMQKNFVTIDGEDAKDFDDAIYIEKLSNNMFKLFVAIADVSYYVKPKSALDLEALNRGCSVYLIDRVIPMLPLRLSNGICSLVPNEPRFVFVCEMLVDQRGNVKESKIYEGVIKSKARLTYTKVNDLFEHKNVEISKEIKKMLFDSHELFLILDKKRREEGVIDLEIDEPKFIVDNKNRIIDVSIKKRKDAEKLIEMFMVLANTVVAEQVYWMELPFMYRVHKKPQDKKLLELYTLFSLMGLNIKGKIENVHPKDLQKILDRFKDQENYKVISTIVLRSMEKAVYSPTNIGHFGLALQCYTHFTSPIRRYPDLVVHRLLKQYLLDHKIDKESLESNTKFIALASEQNTQSEIKAVECERDVNSMKEAEFMIKKIGQVYKGVISGVTGFGIFVELPNTIEGLVHISDLKDDYYRFDEKSLSLVGEHTRRVYRLGDNVEIQVKSASKENKEIDFILVDNTKTESISAVSNKPKFNSNRRKSYENNNSKQKSKI